MINYYDAYMKIPTLVALVLSMAMTLSSCIPIAKKNGNLGTVSGLQQTNPTPQDQNPQQNPQEKPTTNPGTATPTPAPMPDFTTTSDGLSRALVTVITNKGTFQFRFYSGPKDAPKTSVYIADLIARGYYNGLSFDRYEVNFVLQMGYLIPDAGEPIKGEFNGRSFDPGVLGIARADDPDSGGSSFFIVLGNGTHLNGKYCAFARVTLGFKDVVMKLRLNDYIIKVSIENKL